MKLYAVIATHNRHELISGLTEKLWRDNVTPIVIDNASTPPFTSSYGVTIFDPEQPPNLSRLWNLGLSVAVDMAGSEEFAVAILNDDLVVYPGFVAELAEGLGGQAAVSHPSGIIGCAYVLRGSLVRRRQLWLDERFRWWYGDNDLEWQARKLGGLQPVRLKGEIRHLYPNYTTKSRRELRAQADSDRAAFLAKWGPDALAPKVNGSEATSGHLR
ncbi:hypothetical protein EDC02_5665 [Micromonospora sp. Llam0]|uniref:glycosyltransferase family 2 protein n=1 Tax=Micromonospora sp. Llam0 TaxID=2485143 RepID=UPI000F967D90|nr:hypothetical protein [Micromonospora sp. Llam0]ROO50807.1 hypothetical protein EDC02_5665 [Micromonospora sp. Llam0]